MSDDTDTRLERDTVEKPREVRTGAIVWGVIVLGVCAFAVLQLFAPGRIDPGAWIAGLVLLLGAILIVAGIFALVRGRDRRT